VSAGSGCSVEARVITPQTRPSTTIGAPTAELKARSRMATPSRPEEPLLSIRAERPISKTIVLTFLPQSGQRPPTWKLAASLLEIAMVVIVPSAS
jgi:hypothetical protein